MVTIEYLLWLKHIADKRKFTVADWGIYSYLAALSLVNKQQTIKVNGDELERVLSIGDKTVSRSLTKLADNGLIRWTRNGYITVLAPAPQWLEKHCRHNDRSNDRLNDPQKSAIVPHAQEAAPVGNPTQPPMGGRVTPTVDDMLAELDSKTLSSDILGKSLDELKKAFNVNWNNQ